MTARGSVVAAFALHAVVVGTLGPRMPAIKERTGTTDGELGIALTGFAVGLVMGSRGATPLMRRFGSRQVLRVALPLMGGALLGPALAGGLPALAAGLVMLGVLAGLADVAMNTQAVDVERAHGRALMSGIHAAWGAGMLGGGALATAFVAAGASVPLHLGAVAVLVAAAVPAVLGALAARDAAPAPAGADPVPPRAVALLAVIAFAAFIGEGALADWSAIYVDDVVGTGPTVAALAFTGFALGLTLSRLVMDRVIRRFGAVPVVRAAALAAAAGLGLALAVPEPATALLGCVLFGAATAPIVPLAFSAAGNLGRDGALAWVVAAGYSGTVLGPAAIGLISEATSLRTGLLLVVAAVLLIAPLAGRVRPAVA